MARDFLPMPGAREPDADRGRRRAAIPLVEGDVLRAAPARQHALERLDPIVESVVPEGRRPPRTRGAVQTGLSADPVVQLKSQQAASTAVLVHELAYLALEHRAS